MSTQLANSMEVFSYTSTPLRTPLKYCSIIDVLRHDAELAPSKEICVHIHADGTREPLTFEELYRKAMKLAKHLISMGIKYGDHVAVSGSNSMEWIVAEYAVLAAGAVATHVILPSKDPNDLLKTLKDTNCKGIMFDPGHTDNHSPILDALMSFHGKPELQRNDLPVAVMFKECTGVPLPNFAGLLNSDVDGMELPTIYPEDTAVIFTTSGSTGLPKMAEMTHYAIVNASSRIPPICGEDKSTMKVYNDRPFGWIGGSPVGYITRQEPRVFVDIVQESTSERTLRIWKIIKSEKCTHCLFSPFFMTDLIGNKKELLKLDYRMKVISTGGQLIGSKYRDIIGSFCDKFVVLYGSTEVNIITHTAPLLPGDEIKVGNVGKPFEGVEIRIADGNGRPLVKGEVGEVQVRSPFYSKGYYGRPDLAEESFTPEGHWFRTGDVGEIDDDGELTIKGKSKDMIIRGMGKVFTGVIEEGIANMDGVKEVVVVSVPDDRLLEEVCACYVVKEDSHVSREDVINYCEFHFGRLAEEGLGNMPSHFVHFSDFPRLNTGKPDKVKIRELALERLNLRGKGGK